MESEFTFERLNSNSLKDLQFLFNDSRKRADINVLIKKYDTAVFGAEHVGFLAYCKTSQKPAAFYGVLPVTARFKQQTILIAQSADTITHPDFRKKGLFISLAKKTYELCSEVGIKLLFGVPNYNSFNGFVKRLDWQHKGNFVVHTKKIKTIPINYLVSRTPFLKKPYVLFVKCCMSVLSSKNDSTAFSNNPERAFYIPKNSNYKSYKSALNHFEISIFGVSFLISFNKFLRIGGINENNGNLKKALGRLRWIAILTGCHKIVYQVHEEFQNTNTSSGFNGYTKSVGLPFIQKTIDPSFDFEELLFVDYFDFDTF